MNKEKRPVDNPNDETQDSLSYARARMNRERNVQATEEKSNTRQRIYAMLSKHLKEDSIERVMHTPIYGHEGTLHELINSDPERAEQIAKQMFDWGNANA